MASTASQIKYQISQAKTPKGRVKKDTFHAVFEDIDLGEAIQYVAAQEVGVQVKLGNPPTKMTVDGSPSKKFQDAQYRVVVAFGDVRQIAEAAVAVVRQLAKVTKVKTGRAIMSLQVWTIDDFDTNKDPGKKRFSNASFVSTTAMLKLAQNLKPGGAIVIAGPMVDYGRKLFWNPEGGGKRTKRVRRTGYDRDTGKIVNIKATASKNQRDVVLRRLQRKYRGVYITGRWVKERPVGTRRDNDRWPGIAIGDRRRGK